MAYYIETLNHVTPCQIGYFLLATEDSEGKTPANFTKLKEGDIVFHYLSKKTGKGSIWGCSRVKRLKLYKLKGKGIKDLDNMESQEFSDREELEKTLIEDLKKHILESGYDQNKDKIEKDLKEKIIDKYRIGKDGKYKNGFYVGFLENKIKNREYKYTIKRQGYINSINEEEELLENLLKNYPDCPTSSDIEEKPKDEESNDDKDSEDIILFLEDEEKENIIKLLERKKNLILQGPPGVGKTFISLQIARLMNIPKKNVEMVQFHQSYSYEDFIMGYRPSDSGTFELKDGIFYKFIERAKKNKNEKFLFIIDEINRGNLSKIFGELMLLIENDKRKEEYSIKLTYNDKEFYIPENVYIIGTMNTADRSLALVDYALRRRFVFITIEPAFKNKKFKEYLEKWIPKEVEGLIDSLEKANKLIEENLGKNYKIGHSYFIPQEKIDDFKTWYENIVKYEIMPLMEEYFFDNNDKIKEIKDLLEYMDKDKDNKNE